jgi:hypothetical protein
MESQAGSFTHTVTAQAAGPLLLRRGGTRQVQGERKKGTKGTALRTPSARATKVIGQSLMIDTSYPGVHRVRGKARKVVYSAEGGTLLGEISTVVYA